MPTYEYAFVGPRNDELSREIGVTVTGDYTSPPWTIRRTIQSASDEPILTEAMVFRGYELVGEVTP